MKEQRAIRERYARVAGTPDERGRRAVAASEAPAEGRGGISAVARATGLSRDVSRAGIRERRGLGPVAAPGRIRRPGGGRKKIADRDPASPLRWTSTSVRRLAAARGDLGHRVSHQWVAEALRDQGYRLQGNRKAREGSGHPARDAQFAHIAAEAALAAGEPVISVDTEKKELVGDFKDGGREWRPRGEPEEVRVHALVIPGLGRVSPYGVYDLAAHAGWVSVGIDHDTAEFAVASLRRWWPGAGRARYPGARRLLITAAGGGSNGARVRLGQWALPRLADETGLALSVCHRPPGTSKWNKSAHRLCSFITQNWRGKPLVSYAVLLDLIAATTTAAGLTVERPLDTDTYPAGQKVSDAQMATVRLQRDAFHGDWNHTSSPHAPPLDVVVL